MTTITTTELDEISATRLHRFRLNRAGILNVWQYDDQQFDFADGRLLLRGANGAGKSKTLEMLLPFVLDGDKARMTASARHHTSLLWLMTDGYEAQGRVGYLWVEFARTRPEGGEEFLTCGVGIRSSASARTATPWFFTTPLRIGAGLLLEDDAGPLSRPRLADTLGEDGNVFDQARAYKEHVGRVLFGLDVAQYDEVLRLLYWLRQPQIGEDIEPARLAGQLLEALPQLDEQSLRAAGDTFDELAAVGEQLDRRASAARALTTLSETYVGYAAAAAGDRAAGFLTAHRDQVRKRSNLRAAEEHHDEVQRERAELEGVSSSTRREFGENQARLRQLEQSPEARSQQRLTTMAERAAELDRAAGAAERAFQGSERQWRDRERRLVQERDEILSRVAAHGATGRSLDKELGQVAPGATLASPLGETVLSLEDAKSAARLDDLITDHPRLADTAEQVVGRRQAAVIVVQEAMQTLRTAEQESSTQNRRAAEAEERWEKSLANAVEAEHHASEQVDRLWTQLRDWNAEPAAPDWQLPEELTVEVLESLNESATNAAEPVLGELRTSQQRAGIVRKQATDRIDEVSRHRDEIAAESDPAPPAPTLERTARPDGEPLWRLVDFSPQLTPEDRAGLEAALQACGLLDAWVRPDGRLLESAHLDTVLAVGPAAAGPSLADILVSDLPAECDVSAAVLDAVLRRVGVRTPDGSVQQGGAAWVALDGSWSLGPAEGRADKAKAQYVGATARADERQRRLDEVLASLDEAQRLHDRAAAELDDLAGRIAGVERWLRAAPRVQPLLRAWATLDERSDRAASDESAHLAAQEEAQAARREVGRRRDELERLGREHQTPTDTNGLAALAQRLGSVVQRLHQLIAAVPGLRRELNRWREEHDAVTTGFSHVQALQSEATRARDQANQTGAELEELEAAVGADVASLRARLAELQTAISTADELLQQHASRLRDLDQAVGRADQAVGSATERLEETERELFSMASRFAELVDSPGLLAAAAGHEPADPAPLVATRSLTAGDPLPSGLLAIARSLGAAGDGDVADHFNQVYKVYTEALTGPAADHEPRLLTVGELLAVVGRDDGGEHPITELAARVNAAVERDRGLLTQREREKFEQHILGELGDAIRRRRLEAEELVAAMNRLLGGVSTSQGIRVKLDWRLREDVPAEAREAVKLLTQPIGALLPEERAKLRDCLHRLIEVSRAEQPELSYADHLSAALDYRRWFAFRIRYTRPEADGRWMDLLRRSPLSQGEQKVLCYLPLFAAAAAHFSSLAGAAPHAPRLVLLDDAFPKIDVRTHPLLFGLLVQLDLDFVITSERLWGDHETLPSLAIYEALRDPGQRGIAQYEFRWDGRMLRAMH